MYVRATQFTPEGALAGRRMNKPSVQRSHMDVDAILE